MGHLGSSSSVARLLYGGGPSMMPVESCRFARYSACEIARHI